MIEEFLVRYFVNPIAADSGYNIVNTLVFAIVLIGVIPLLTRLFERTKVKLDLKFYIAMMPLVVLGASVRALVDFGYYPPLYIHLTQKIFLALLITPGIYFLIFLPALLSVALAPFAKKRWKIEEYKFIAILGTACLTITHLLLYTLYLQPGSAGFRILPLLLVLAFGGLMTYLFYLFSDKFFPFFRKKIPFVLVATHLFDASTTFVGMQFYCFWEKHVLPTLVINIFGPFSMYFLKLLVVPAVVYFLWDMENKTERNLIYFVVFVLGLAPGLRNLLLLMFGGA